MIHHIAESVTYLAELRDPTPDGTLINLINVALAALALILVPLFGFYLVAKFAESKGATGSSDLRPIVVTFIAAEAFIGAAAIIANISASTLGGALGG